MPEGIPDYVEEIEALKNEGRFADALKKIQTLMKKHADDYRLHEELADIYLSENNVVKAEEALQVAQKLNPESITGTYLLWYIHISKGNFTLGVELLEKANSVSVNNPEIIRNLGWGLVMTGKTHKGIALLRRALNLAPNDDLIMEDLWVALIGDGFVEEGSEFLKKAGKEYRINELLTMMRLG